jgi:hypothetical protein
MQADILPYIPPGGIILLGTNADYALDEITGLVHLREYILQEAAEREIHFLLHPDEERRVAAMTYQSLKQAFDAAVVGDQLATLLSEKFLREDLACDLQKSVVSS